MRNSNEIPLSIGPCPECNEPDYHNESCSMYVEESYASEKCGLACTLGAIDVRNIDVAGSIPVQSTSDMSLFDTVLYYLQKCNDCEGDPHVLKILSTPKGVTYTVKAGQEDIIESSDLAKIGVFLKTYVSWVD
jgi:hypothetical protein